MNVPVPLASVHKNIDDDFERTTMGSLRLIQYLPRIKETLAATSKACSLIDIQSLELEIGHAVI
jgi:hypothetical protein